MKRRGFIHTALLGTGAVTLSNCSYAKGNGAESAHKKFELSKLAPKPPLGWNSFDSYGVYLHHDAAIENLKAMAEKLKPHGYEYFVIDGGWYGEYELFEGTIYPLEKHAKNVRMDEYGIYQPSKTYFPKGFDEIIGLAHELGLKTGIHLMRGIPRRAVEQNLPIKNSPYTAADVADTNSICGWNDQNYGVDVSKPGAQDWYNSVYQQMADWGFDFVKVDDLTPYPKEILAVAKAIENTGREMIYSLSPGGGVYFADLYYYRRANMVRTTKDIWDRGDDIDKGFTAWKKFQGIAHEGFWPDLDMIPFGQLQLMSPRNYAAGEHNELLSGEGFTRTSRLTPQQMRTFITMRALAASPLFVGGDLPTMDDYSLSLLTNQHMLECNQNGVCGYNVYEKDGIEVWITQQKEFPGQGWIGVFNRNMVDKNVSLSKEDLGLLNFIVNYKLVPVEGEFAMLDVWNSQSFKLKNEPYKAFITADDVHFLKYTHDSYLV
jgi:hypothetical protein